MYYRKFLLTIFFLTLFCCCHYSEIMAQKDATLDVKKPKEYENRVLGSDKTFTTKYNIPRRLLQSMSTHYNFFFNANIKLNDVVDNAKRSFKEDFTELLPFYNYSLDATAAQKTELDSVLQKCNAGILLHDLRNEWIDDMYFLMGKAYFFKKLFDSADVTFQYLNYYFQPKKDEELGFKKYLGSNLNDEGNVYSVSTKEKNGIISRVFSEPPRRNDALLWKLRNYIEDSSYIEASALIQNLNRDQLLPKRLKPALEEMQAYLFYKNKIWDSTAHHLIMALDNSENLEDRARREFLIAQLRTLSNQKNEAAAFYDLCIKHTADPVMEVYARLNKIKITNGDNEAAVIAENIKQLLKMARRDKYYNYRDIIYYMAAQMEMQRKDYDAAKILLLKSVAYSVDNPEQRNRSFLYLGNLAFDKKDYPIANSAYDSLDINSPVIKDSATVALRKQVLGGIVNKLETINTQDSLQNIASLPEEEREKFLKAASKRLRKESGIKEYESMENAALGLLPGNVATDMFQNNGTKGDWYFDNNTLKSKGFTSFRNTWGARPNADNWRRMSNITAQVKTTPAGNQNNFESEERETEATALKDISVEGLLKTLPLTPEAIQSSNDSIQSALMGLGKTFKDQLEDYQEAIQHYETLLNRFPETPFRDEAIFDLYYCYTRLNLPIKARQYKEILARVAPQSPYLELIENPQAVNERKNKVRDEANKNYDRIYDLFLEGQFEKAIIEKTKADSIFGEKYWTQQLLYIESIYYIKQHDENSAVNALQRLISVNPEAPISKKAETLLDVLKRREAIEHYLTNLKIERAKEDSVSIPVLEEKPLTAAQEQVDLSIKQRAKELPVEKASVVKPVIDSSIFNKPQPALTSEFSFDPSSPHFVAMVLHKVDPVFGNEAKNAFNRYNRESFNEVQIGITIEPIDEENKLLLLSGFSDAGSALNYLNKARPVAGTQIVPWLTSDKYSFIVISEKNLELLKDKKDWNAYKIFFKKNYPSEAQ